jgi:AMMECR1 domain-containing protein
MYCWWVICIFNSHFFNLKMQITQEGWTFINCGNNTFYVVFNSTQKVLLPQLMKMYCWSVICIFNSHFFNLKMQITQDKYIFINYGNNNFCVVFNSIQKVLLP